MPHRDPPPEPAGPVRWVRLSLIEHHAYCPRQAVLTDREPWTDNKYTAHGNDAHRHVDTAVVDHRRGLTVHHAVPLRHDALLLYGIADAVEDHPASGLTPVEHKAGPSRVDHRPATLQAVAQALCLADMTSQPVPVAVVYYARDGTRIEVDVATHTADFHDTLLRLRRDLDDPQLPPWPISTAPCRRCSLRPTCLPELANQPPP